jgi:hypothetical protein
MTVTLFVNASTARLLLPDCHRPALVDAIFAPSAVDELGNLSRPSFVVPYGPSIDGLRLRFVESKMTESWTS